MKLSYSWKALIAVALGTTMLTLDASIIIIALPEMTRVFHADLRTVMWVTVAFILVSSSLMLLFGKLSDFVGRKKIYIVGFGIFTLAMTACSLAQSLQQIILFRIVQGVGAAMAIGCSTAIVTHTFPGKMMGKGLGILGAAVSAGFIIGPVAGGFILEYFGWRAIFYTRVPLSILALILAILVLEREPVHKGKINPDLLGAVTSFAGLFCFLFAMGQIKTFDLKLPVAILAGAGLAMLFLLPLVERRAKNPIINFELFRDRDFTFAMAGFFVFFLTMSLYVVLFPFYLMNGINLSASDSGLLLAVLPVTAIFASPASGALFDRFGPRWPATLGAAAVALAFILMLQFSLQTEIWMVVSVLVLLGIGSGVFQPPNNSTIMSAVDPRYHGSASAMIATNRQVAMSIGMALAGIIFSARQSVYLSGAVTGRLFRESTISAFRDVISLALALSAVVVLLSLVESRGRLRTEE